MRLLLAAFLILLPTVAARAQASRADDSPNGTSVVPSRASSNLDATFFHLDMDLDFAAQRIVGRTRIVGRVVNSPLASLLLDFLMPRAGGDLRVDSVRLATGQKLNWQHDEDLLSIDLAKSYQVDEVVTVDVYYSGHPQDPESFRFGYNSQGNPVAWTLSEPYGARSWWPTKEYPSDKADSVRVTVTVPENMRVGSHGLLRSETRENGLVTYDWVSHYPIAPYLVSIAAGVYEAIEQTYTRPDSLARTLGPLTMPVLHYQYEGQNLYAKNGPGAGWAHVTDALAVFEYWFGPYPFPTEKYGHAQFTWGGGMEHQTMSSMGGNSIDLVTHELAHQWYGDAVTNTTWPHLWLNEGFATYAELLFRESRDETYPGTFRTGLLENQQYARQAPGTLVVQDTTNDNLFDYRRVYSKGGVVLHMLRTVIGTEDFKVLLKRWASHPEFQYRNATTGDLQRVAEEVSGEDLDFFFKQWVTDGTGYPVYEVAWNSRPSESGHQVVVQVDQIQSHQTSNQDVFSMPVTIRVGTAGGTQDFRIWNNRRQQRFLLDVPEEPVLLAFDPEQDLLRNVQVPIVKDTDLNFPESSAELLGVYPNPATGIVNVGISLTSPGARVDVYDVLGRRVLTIVDGEEQAGQYDYTFDSARLPAGIYFVRLEAGDVQEVQRFTVVH